MRLLIMAVLLAGLAVHFFGVYSFPLTPGLVAEILCFFTVILAFEGGWGLVTQFRQLAIDKHVKAQKLELDSIQRELSNLRESHRLLEQRAESSEHRVQTISRQHAEAIEIHQKERTELRDTIVRFESAALEKKQSADASGATLVAFLSQLQEQGRFLDFIAEEVATFSDAQVAGAARFVHAGCRRVVKQYVECVPLEERVAGTSITVAEGRALNTIRFVGRAGVTLPATGKLIHRGWKALRVSPPIVASQTEIAGQEFVISPAEIEIAA